MFLLGSMTLAKLATCPSMAMTTMGAGGAAMGALLPLGGAALGAALGGIAGGTTGGVVSARQLRTARVGVPHNHTTSDTNNKFIQTGRSQRC